MRLPNDFVISSCSINSSTKRLFRRSIECALKMILRIMLNVATLVQLLSFVVAKFRLQLLHNNDMHARFDEIEESAESWSCESSANECYGGFARIKQAADQLIEDAASQNIPSIFLNAGDTFQGTPYYTLHKWKIVAPLLDAIGFNVTCLGNHEFDDGIDNLVQYLNHIRTPVVACNLNTTTEKRLQLPNLRPHIILNVGDERVGIIGYLTPTTTETSRSENLEILDEIPSLRREARRLINMGINIIIGLGHSGIERDKEIAEEIEELSLIVGGHSHTMMYSPKEASPSTETAEEDYPFFVTQKSGKRVPIVQAYKHTKYLGRLLLEFDDNGVVISADGNPVLLNSSIPKNPEMNRLVESWTSPSKDLLKTVKGYVRVPLQRSNISALEFESNAGNFVTDAFIHHGVKCAKESNSSRWTDAPIAIYNRGAIRTDLTQGDVTLGDLYTMVPYDDNLYEVQLLGSTILDALEHTVTVTSEEDTYPILDLAGLRVVYDLDQPIGSRVSSVFVLCNGCTVPRYEALKPDKMYTAVTTDFLLQGKSNLVMFPSNKTRTCNGTTARDAVIEYIEQLYYIYPMLEGRLAVLQARTHDSTSTYSLFEGSTVLAVCAIALTISLLIFCYYRYTRKMRGNFSYQYQRLSA